MTTIEITNACIRNGTARTCGDCPIALGVKPHVDPSVRVEVFKHWVYLIPKTEQSVELHLPPEAIVFIRKFDDGDKVEPFEFGLPIPERFLVQQ